MNNFHNKDLISVDGKYIFQSYYIQNTLMKVSFPYRKPTTDFGERLSNFIKNSE